MPENPTLPKPEQVLGNSTLPSPNQVFSEKPTTTAYEKALAGEQTGIDKFKQTIANIPDMEEGKKKIVEDIALRGLRGEELSNAILTLQGKHPHQNEDTGLSSLNWIGNNNKYYLNDKGVPIPLKNSERPPVGYEVASVWGTQKEANDDAWYTDIAKTVYNVLPSSAENIVDLLQTGYEAVTDKESEYLNMFKNSANFLKMAKDEDLNKSLFNTQGIDEWKDLADKERWDFTPETIWGTVNSLAGSIGEFAMGGSGVAGKGISQLAKGEKFTRSQQVIGSVLTNLGEVRDAATEAGLEGRDRALFTSLVAPVISAVDVKWGLPNKIVNNPAANEEKKAFLKTLGKSLAKDEAGNLTKEAVDELVKVTATGYTQVAKKIGQLTAKDVLQEGGQEAGQQFIQNASEQLWDKLTDDEKKKFGTDAFSPESFAEYVQNGLAGLLGGAPTVFAYNKAKQLAKQEAQDNSAYSIVQKGEKAVDAFKINVAEEVKRGNLTPEEAANAIFKVDAYKTYNDQVGTLNIPEEEKKTVFKLTFEKANLESQIPDDDQIKKLKKEGKFNALDEADVDSKKQQAKEIQKEINAIIQKNEVLNKTTTAAKKTVEKVDEEMQPEEQIEGEAKVSQTLKDLAAKYRGEGEAEIKAEKPKKVVDERPFEQIPPLDWNTKRASEKFNILKNKLEKDNDTVAGNLRLEFGGEGRTTSDVINVELPGKKFVVTASSAKDLVTQLRGHFKTEFVKGDIENLPVVVKPIQLTSGKTVLGIYNEDNGRFISYVREHDTGKSKYSEKEVEELQHMQAVSRLTKSEMDYYKQKRNLPPEEGEAGALMVPTTPVTPQTPSGETIQIDETETTGPVRENLPSSEKVGAKGEKKAKVTTEEARNIKNAVNAKPNTFEEAVLRYFLYKGKINTKDFKRYTGFGVKDERTNKVKGGKEFKSYIWVYKNDAPSIDNLVGRLWTEDMEMGEEYDEQALINEFFEILKVTPGLRTALSSLLDSKKRTIETSEQYASPEAIAYAEQLDEEEKLINTRDLTDEEIQDLLAKEEYAKEYDEYYAQRFEEDKGYERYPEEQKSSEGANIEDIKRVVERMKEVMPKISITYNDKIPVAGVLLAEGKGIEINPYRAGIDTPIHEVGHILISAMRNDSAESKAVIDAATEQLKGTDLWNEIAERYPELSEEELGDEVLAEAIGREGEGIFETEMEKSKFMQYLEYIFNWIKQKLGVDKNIAKSLAQQIIAGIRTKGYEYEGTERQQKEKGKKYKEFWEMSDKEKMRAITLSFDQYREKKFKKLNEEIARDIQLLKKELEKEELSEAERNYIESLLSQINRVKKDQLKDYYQYREDLKAAKEITDSLSNPDITEDERVEAINDLYTLDEIAREAYLNDAKLKYAKHYWDLQVTKLSSNEKFIYEKALKSDIKPWDISMKSLSHMTEAVPELQQLHKTFDNSSFEMVDESSAKKNTYEKLGRAVIEETNKKLGITGKAKSLLSSDSAKYFEYMDNGEGNLLTLDEAKAKGLSKAQIEFLKYMRELIAERNKDVMESDIYSVERQVLKTDPTFAEAFKGEGLLRAVSNSLGSSYNLRQVRIPYTNPNTGITEIDNFANIEKEIIKYGNKGAIQKAKAIGLLMHYNAKARKQLKQGVNVDEKENPLEIKQGGEYSLDYRGQLVGKFDRPRDKNRGYSRDFYKAGLEFIDDFMHVKHMSKIVPIVNSLEYMAKEGYDNPLTGTKIAAKPNAAKWIDEWRKMHLFKAQDSKHPALDVALRFLRHMTSMTTMMFNVTAAAMNAFMGNYNNWRAENGGKVALGNKRLFGEVGKHKVDKDYAYGGVNPYAVDILRKYKIVSTDYDSNPKAYVGRLFESLGHGLTRMGEFQVQGSMFLGLMSDEEYNSFEYKKDKHGIDQLVVKEGVDEAKLKEKLLGYKNRVSDIQGKYAEKDRRNIMNSELGKTAFQFRVWIPDWWKERFGEEYITADGEVKRGSWREFTGDALKELRKQVNEQGVKAIWNNKNAMSNLKGAMAVALFMSLSHANDDDKKKRKKVDMLDQALGNLLFIFDPDQSKYMISNPIASIGTMNKFIDAFQAVIEMDVDKFEKNAVRLVPGNKLYRQIEDLAKD